MPEKPKPKEINPQNEERKSTYAEVVKNSKIIHKNENKNAEKLKENNKTIYVELGNKSNIPSNEECSIEKVIKASKEKLVKK